MSSNAKAKFTENSQDIAELWSIHQEIAGQGQGRKYGVEVLNRSAVVFITACWESYVEDLATEAFDFLLANSPTSDAIPQKVKAAIGNKILDDPKNPLQVWRLADTGWRQLLQDHKTTTLQKWLEPFHSPKSSQVNKLYEDLLGIKKLSSKWRWKHMTSKAAEQKLDGFIQVRGDIAHRLNTDKPVQKLIGTKYHEHVKKLVGCCEIDVHAHLLQLTGKAPW